MRAASLICAISLAACSASSDPPAPKGGSPGGQGGTGAGGDGTGGFPPAGSGGIGGTAGVAAGGTGGGGAGPVTAIDDCLPVNSAGLDEATVQLLEAGGDPTGMRWLYPYDGTVFPRGLLSPLLMWDGEQAVAVYVHIHSSTFDYKGCLAPTGKGQLLLPQAAWDAIGASSGGAADPFTVELSQLSGGGVKGPITEQIVVAKATLKGSIYYNSYSSKLAQQTGFLSGGAVLRIPPGGSAEVFLGQTGCTGCHSVSANGSRLLAQTLGGAGPGGFPVGGGQGAAFGLTPGGAVNPPAIGAAAGAEFSGVFPDGSLYLASAHPSGMGPRSAGLGSPTATLYETDTGVAVTGTGIPDGAMVPTFSPDGTQLTFNDYAIGNGHGLAIMDFSAATRTASNYKPVYQEPSAFPGWPFFVPDNRAVVFALGSANDFSGMGAGLGGLGLNGPISDLFIVDTTTGTANILAKAMGFATPADSAANTTYLPFGVEDIRQNYYPTVSPVAAGGYFWIFFDSYRHLGNLGRQRQLWGAAIDVSANGDYSIDGSHPAFYLPGQELGTGNHRAFTALDACLDDGNACTTGIDCCCGACTDAVCACPQGCSNIDEKCETAADCCDGSQKCIGGFCAYVVN